MCHESGAPRRRLRAEDLPSGILSGPTTKGEGRKLYWAKGEVEPQYDGNKDLRPSCRELYSWYRSSELSRIWATWMDLYTLCRLVIDVGCSWERAMTLGKKDLHARASLGEGLTCMQLASNTSSSNWGNISFSVVVLNGTTQNPTCFVKYFMV